MEEQQVIFECGGIRKLQQVLLEKNIRKIFVISGIHLIAPAESRKILSFLSGFEQKRYTKLSVNVTMEEIAQCYGSFKEQGYEAVIAIGGGSVIDLAKGILFLHNQDDPLKKPLFIAVPTTAGSGSEATCFAVVYEHQKKISLQHNLLRPDIIALDTDLTLSLPAQQTAISGIDAVAQAIESFWNVNATKESQSFSQEALVILLRDLPATVHHPSAALRQNVLWAAYLSGRAINITRTTGPHALSYFLTAQYGVPHGQAVALFLPVFFIYNSGVSADTCNHTKGKDAVLHTMQQLYQLLHASNGKIAADCIRKFIKQIGLATTLHELGIEKENILYPLIEEVNIQRFANNPVMFNKEQLTQLCKEYL